MISRNLKFVCMLLLIIFYYIQKIYFQNICIHFKPLSIYTTCAFIFIVLCSSMGCLILCYLQLPNDKINEKIL